MLRSAHGTHSIAFLRTCSVPQTPLYALILLISKTDNSLYNETLSVFLLKRYEISQRKNRHYKELP